MAKRHSRFLKEESLNLIPIMNLVSLLIPFLLMTASFIQYAVINVAAPRISARAEATPPEEQEKQPLNLTLVITDQGFHFKAQQPLPGQQQQASTDAATQGPEIPLDDCNQPGDPEQIKDQQLLQERVRRGLGPEACRYNWQRLRERFLEIKEQYPDERQLIISAEPKIDYEVIIKAMDTSRCKEDPSQDAVRQNPPCGSGDNELFPDVVLAAGAG